MGGAGLEMGKWRALKGIHGRATQRSALLPHKDLLYGDWTRPSDHPATPTYNMNYQMKQTTPVDSVCRTNSFFFYGRVDEGLRRGKGLAPLLQAAAVCEKWSGNLAAAAVACGVRRGAAHW